MNIHFLCKKIPLFGGGGLVIHRLPHVGGEREPRPVSPVKGLGEEVFYPLHGELVAHLMGGHPPGEEAFRLPSDGKNMIHFCILLVIFLSSSGFCSQAPDGSES